MPVALVALGEWRPSHRTRSRYTSLNWRRRTCSRTFLERTDIFNELSEYYREAEYRFEIPVDEFPEVQDLLERNHYKPIFVEDIEHFTVVKEQYTEHADILRNSVMHWSRRGYNFFIMEDPQAVEFAIEQGATRIGETDLVLGI